MPDDPAKPPRFPYVAALLCAACLGAAGWTWMRYSYCWEVTDSELGTAEPESLYQNPLADHYVRFRTDWSLWEDLDPEYGWTDPARGVWALEFVNCSMWSSYGPFRVYVPTGTKHGGMGPVAFTGRVIANHRDYHRRYCLDTSYGRWHGASIGGLVGGAMGVFVFAVALRHWLKKRRAWRKEAEGA